MPSTKPSRRKCFRVEIEQKSVYAIDVEAYDDLGAKELARDIYLNAGFASGAMVELLSKSTFAIVSTTEQTNESTTDADR